MTPKVPPKILQVINSCVAGGAEKLAVALHRHYIARGVPARLVSLYGTVPHDIADTAISLDLPSIRHPCGLKRLTRTLRLAEYRGTEVLHAHLMPDMVYGPLAAWLAGLRVRRVLTVHSTSNNRLAVPLAGKTLDRHIYRPFDALACISEGTRERLLALHPDLAAVAVTINNGIDLGEILPAAPATNAYPVIVMTVGRLAAVKNFPMLLRALSHLHDLPIELRLVGSGPERTALENLAHRLRISGRVKFLGARDDVPAQLSQAHIFALTSHYEGFGLAVAEAMAAGLPIVVSDVIGMRSLVGDEGVCGFLVPPDDDLTLAERLRFLVQNAQVRSHMGCAGAQRAGGFSIETTVGRYLELYASLTDRKS